MKKIQFGQRASRRLREYEEKHPFMPIIITLSVVGVIAILVFAGVKIRRYSDFNSSTNVRFEDENFEKEIKKILKKDNIVKADLESIQTLQIENNVDLIDIQDIEKLENLVELEITGCSIEDISALGEMDKLTRVDLSLNNITYVDGIEQSQTIKELKLYRNKVRDMSLICEMENLLDLDISSNNLSVLPEEIQQMTKLERLNISGNRLLDIQNVNGMSALGELYAGSNKLTEAPSLKNLPSLWLLDLSGNVLVDVKTVGEIETLEQLNLSRNYLNGLEFISNYPQLYWLNISYNQYTTLEGIEQCKGLQYLDIRGTEVADVSVLQTMPEFNSIYVNDEFDRTQLDFMIDRFRNADKITKEYLLDKQYKVNE